MAAFDLPASLCQFSNDLYEQVRATVEKKQNIVISPLSMHLAVALAFMGADGKTASEMKTCLKLGESDKSVIAKEFEKLLKSLKGKFHMGNKVYAMNGLHLNATFQEFAQKQFNSETQTLDFADTNGSATKINEWIKYKSHQRIQNIIVADLLDEDTRLLLANAAYFKGLWDHQFDADATKVQPFFNSETDCVNVDMMHKKSVLPYAEPKDLDAKAIVLNYENSDLSMVIVLPNQRTGLPALDAKLTKTSLASIVQQTEAKAKVIVSLPKFRVELGIEMADVLRKIGLKAMFSGSADFSGVLEETDSIYMTDIVHKAVIEVNEKGTEAAATAKLDLFTMDKRLDRPVSFNADHPFRYFIRNASNIVLFSGCFRYATGA